MADTNAKAVELAKRCRVPVEEVLGWLSDRFSVQEIERACRIAKEKHAAPSDVLAMLDAGLDWRAIEKALRAVPDVALLAPRTGSDAAARLAHSSHPAHRGATSLDHTGLPAVVRPGL
ncbi:MAG TPA: hypothetical protein PLD57_12820, partial [Aggregatilineales bacterium]|nr:hypothetical protein [Aggregatilineales bacterium]